MAFEMSVEGSFDWFSVDLKFQVQREISIDGDRPPLNFHEPNDFGSRALRRTMGVRRELRKYLIIPSCSVRFFLDVHSMISSVSSNAGSGNVGDASIRQFDNKSRGLKFERERRTTLDFEAIIMRVSN
jgi:hypothetical protein